MLVVQRVSLPLRRPELDLIGFFLVFLPAVAARRRSRRAVHPADHPDALAVGGLGHAGPELLHEPRALAASGVAVLEGLPVPVAADGDPLPGAVPRAAAPDGAGHPGAGVAVLPPGDAEEVPVAVVVAEAPEPRRERAGVRAVDVGGAHDALGLPERRLLAGVGHPGVEVVADELPRGRREAVARRHVRPPRLLHHPSELSAGLAV